MILFTKHPILAPYHPLFKAGKSRTETTKCLVGDESGRIWKMRENFSESHVKWILALWSKEWVWEDSEAHIKEWK